MNSLNTFEQIKMNPLIFKAIKDLNYKTPSAIQTQTLPILLGGKTDFIGLATTGTGKTAAFSIPLLEKLNPKLKSVQTLVLCPTRELASQVCEQINDLGKHMGIRALPIYGGANYSDQLRGLKRGASVVVGTPGRIVDHLERGTLDLAEVQQIVLDEADEMISMGFKDEMEKILSAAPKGKYNTWLFSATMSREIRKVADLFLVNPKTVQINNKEMLAPTVSQVYYMCKEDMKPELLCHLIDMADDFYGIIFCQTKQLVADLSDFLTGRGYRVDSLHGDKDQKSRERTLKLFKDRQVQVLVCTDVASRGIDVKDITHVINYSLPRELDSYVHRIGRTARNGKTGFAFSLVTASHKYLIHKIEKLTKSKMTEGRIPSRREINMKRVSKYLPLFDEARNIEHTMGLMDENWKKRLENMTREEIAARFLSILG